MCYVHSMFIYHCFDKQVSDELEVNFNETSSDEKQAISNRVSYINSTTCHVDDIVIPLAQL